ncbi:transposase [Candidatus Pacearchaeota archaeon]|nr:transposase [Candidatus Pacearchaeota archaeon]
MTYKEDKVYEDKQTFKQIFKDNWEGYKNSHRIREVESRDVEKMIDCGDITKGYSEHICPRCKERKKVGLTCKSRFCLSCGRKRIRELSEAIKGRMFRGVLHRHVVLTMPRQLWGIIYNDRSLLKVVADAGALVIDESMNSVKKTKGLKIGIIMVIQTSGRASNFNPHIHLLMTEGGIRSEKWEDANYVDTNILSKKWQYWLLTKLREKLPKTKEKKAIIEECFVKYPKGFIVYAKKEKLRKKDIVGYLIKYVVSPSIAYKRILKYDGKVVRYWYNSRMSKEREVIETSAQEFIERMIQHIPEEGFKMIRYYGLYARNQRKRMKRIIEEHLESEGRIERSQIDVVEILSGHIKYREMMIETFGIDPLRCSKCKEEMILEKIVVGGVTVYDLYECKYNNVEKIPTGEIIDVKMVEEDNRQEELISRAA